MSIIANRQFIRSAEVIIGSKVTTTSNAPREPVNARVFTGRVNFSVVKTDGSEPNKATINLYNIAQDTRNFLEEKSLVVFLKAGYIGAISTIFFGDIVERFTSRSGPDVVTKIECGDQEQILATANVQLGFQENSTNKQIIMAAADALSLTVPPRQLANIPTVRNQKNFSYSGTARDLLEQQAELIDYNFSIQDGEIQFLPKESDDGQDAVLVTPETGLIGFPTKSQDGLQFQTLLNPEIRPKRAVKLESKQFQGQFGAKAGSTASASLDGSGQTILCTRATHNGDSQEGNWFTDVEGIIK